MPDVTIYTRQFCGYCSAAKRLLAEKGVAFKEIDATAAPEKRNEMIERSGRWRFSRRSSSTESTSAIAISFMRSMRRARSTGCSRERRRDVSRRLRPALLLDGCCGEHSLRRAAGARSGGAGCRLRAETPEMTNIVQRDRRALEAELHSEETDPAIKRFSALAAELGIILHFGSLALKAGSRIANRAFVFGRKGELLACSSTGACLPCRSSRGPRIPSRRRRICRSSPATRTHDSPCRAVSRAARLRRRPFPRARVRCGDRGCRSSTGAAPCRSSLRVPPRAT